jgi:stress-induced-phosphoprotein 1
MQDPRMMNVILGLMGIDASAMGKNPMDAEDEPAPAFTPSSSSSSSSASTSKPSKPKEEPVVEEDLTEEEKEKREKRKASDELKEAGNGFYKKRQFEEALAKYEKAFELDETNVTVLTNKSG